MTFVKFCLAVLVMVAIASAAPYWDDVESIDIDYNPYSVVDKRGARHSSFIKRRGRELFGKRSVAVEAPDYDVAAANFRLPERFRRRASELFG